MWNDKYLAIWDARNEEYKWYIRLKASYYVHPPSGPTVTTYHPTGRFTNREDGMQAEIFEPKRADEATETRGTE